MQTSKCISLQIMHCSKSVLRTWHSIIHFISIFMDSYSYGHFTIPWGGW